MVAGSGAVAAKSPIPISPNKSACKIVPNGLRYASPVGTSPCKLSFPELRGDREWPHL